MLLWAECALNSCNKILTSKKKTKTKKQKKKSDLSPDKGSSPLSLL